MTFDPGQGGSSSPASATDAASVTGSYGVSTGSLVGYRVSETLVGRKTTAVGRTSEVSEELTISGTSVTAATFTTQMGSVASDQSGRNASSRTRIMDTAKYPTSTFTLTKPIALSAIPSVGAPLYLIRRRAL